MKSLLTITILLAITGSAFADGLYYSEQYHTIQSVDVYEIVEDANGNEKKIKTKSQKLPTEFEQMLEKGNQTIKSAQNVGEVLMMTKELIALGKQLYGFIKENQPVVNIESTPISVLPRDVKGAPVQSFALSNWNAPKTKKFRVEFKNYLGMTPVTFDYVSIYSYGGKFNGKGFYITGAQIKPVNVEVSWGYQLDATFSVQSITNMGSSEDPVAAAVLNIDYKVKTLMKSSSYSRAFFINGLGHTQTLH